jgi:ubiquinone/menaquinone biosynthesis C-methylase UbiE
MNQHQAHSKTYAATAAENYQRFFVPTIGAPVANDLIAIADLHLGEHVLDVACGTGLVTRLAAERVGAGGSVTGLDIDPGMLAVARSASPSDLSIIWQQASADALPYPDGAFNVVLCQMGLQFLQHKLTALREMRRVLVSDGRAIISVPGPKPPLFAIMTDTLARHLGPEAASFSDLVFSLHDIDELKELMRNASFRNIDVKAKPKSLSLPAPADFLWEYIYSTPLATAANQSGETTRSTLEREVCERWQRFEVDGSLFVEVGVTTTTALK